MKNILIITEVAPPCEIMTASSKRLEGFARYLPEFGWVPVILNLQCHCAKGKPLENDQPWAGSIFLKNTGDIKNLKEKLSHWSEKRALIIRVSPVMGRIRGLWQLFAELTGARFRFDDHFGSVTQDLGVKELPFFLKWSLIPLRKTLSWLSSSLWNHTDWVKKGSTLAAQLCDDLHIDVILSTSPGLANHVIAYKVSSEKKIPWVADFRDSIQRKELTHFPISWRLRFLKKAFCAIHVTPDEAARDRQWIGRRSFIVENGFLEEDVIESTKDLKSREGIFILRYFGIVNEFSPLNLFFMGFKEFIISGAVPFSQVRFEYYGHSIERVEALVKKFGLVTYSELNPNVSQKDSTKLMAESTVLIKPIDSRFPGCPGTKFYEYLGVQRPILAAGTEEPYVEAILDKTGAGKTGHTASEIAQILRLWHEQFLKTGQLSLDVNQDEIVKYSRRTSAKKLAGILTSSNMANR